MDQRVIKMLPLWSLWMIVSIVAYSQTEEVVDVGYGVKVRKEDLSSAVGVISQTEKIATRPVSNITALLQGQLAGVTVQANGGSPSSTPQISIFGQGSPEGDKVLWVVDGVPNGPVPTVENIESIVVLKDAASAALYGAQSGTSGVVLVTTKKAQVGGAKVAYDMMVGARRATNLIDPLTAEQQVLMRTISYANAGKPLLAGWDTTMNPWVGKTRTQWMEAIFRTGWYQRHNLTVSGGSDWIKNQLSLSLSDDQGILKNTYNRELSLRYNAEFKFNSFITLSQDLVWAHTNSRDADTESDYLGAILSAVYMPSSATIYNPLTGDYGGVTTEDPAYELMYGDNFQDAHGNVENPVKMLETNADFNKKNSVWSTTNLQINKLVEGLQLNNRLTYNLNNAYIRSNSYVKMTSGLPVTNKALTVISSREDAWNLESTVTYDRTFGKHTVGAMAAFVVDRQHALQVQAMWQNAYLDDAPVSNDVAWLAASESLSAPETNYAGLGRLAYNYDSRYFITASLREDYVDILPKGLRSGTFPAFSLAWKVSQEPFFPKTPLVSLLKLRSSWGRVGDVSSIIVNTSEDIMPVCSWETSEQWGVGLDMTMFSERLSLIFNYFDKLTFNLISARGSENSNDVDISELLLNHGEVRNRGVDVSASWNHSLNAHFSYSISGNYAYVKNWVSDIGEEESNGRFNRLNNLVRTALGQPLGSFYLIKTDGIFQTDEEAAAYQKNGKRIQPNAVAGDLKFVDYNDDGIIDNQDRQYVGCSIPKHTFSLSFGATYKDLSLSAMFQGVADVQALYVGKIMLLNDAEGNYNRSAQILDAWSPTNTQSTIPRLCKKDPNRNFIRPSDFYMEDASYLRLKNVTLSYNLTNCLKKNAHLNLRGSHLTVYFSGENLFTITSYSGMDPECYGWDALKYPVASAFSLGIKFTY